MKRDDKYTYDWEAMKRIVAVLLLLASRIDGLAKAGLAPDIRLFCRFLQAEQATREFVADMIFDAQYPLAELACPEEIDAYTFARDQDLYLSGLAVAFRRLAATLAMLLTLCRTSLCRRPRTAESHDRKAQCGDGVLEHTSYQAISRHASGPTSRKSVPP